MIRILFTTESAAPLEAVFDAYINLFTAQKFLPELSNLRVVKGALEQPATGSIYEVDEKPGRHKIRYEVELLSVVPCSSASGTAKAQTHVTNFAYQFFTDGKITRVEGLQELQVRSA